MSLIDNLVCYLKMDEAANTKRSDSTANNNNFTDHSSNVGSVTGILGNAASFTGIAQYLINNAVILPSGPISVSCWVKLTSLTAACYAWAEGAKQFLRVNTAGTVAGSVALAVTTTATISADGNWHHLVMTFNPSVGSGTVNIYVDGVLRATATSQTWTTGATTTILGAQNTATNSGNFALDEVAMWTRTLTDGGIALNGTAGAEIATLYQGGLALAYQNFNTYVDFDAASNSGYLTATSNPSWTHTCTADGNRFLAVDVELLSVPGTTVTGITYGGLPLTFIGAQNVTSFGRVECWGLVGPPSGANTVSVNLSASIACAATAVSYTGVNQRTPTEAFNSAQGVNVGAANATVNITTVTAWDWVHAACVSNDTAFVANQTSRNNVTGTLGSGGDEDTGPQITPGSVTMSYAVAATKAWGIAGYGLVRVGNFISEDEGMTYSFRRQW